jgi:RNA polymerase sigma-70 factor (ECF subfamily)
MTKNLDLNKLRTLNKEDIIEENDVEFIKSNDELKQRDYLLELEEILDEKSFKIVVLHLVYDLKHREIAEYLDLPLGTVCSLYNISMKKIKSIYKKGGNR